MEISTKQNIRNTKVVYLREESLVLLLKKSPNLSLYMLINVMLIKPCTSNIFVALPMLHATAVDCADELINGESTMKGRLAKFSKINEQGGLNKIGEGGQKRNNQ